MRQRGAAALERRGLPERARLLERGHVALADHVAPPGDGLREARVVVVVLRAPRVLVEQLEAEAGGEAGPGRLAVGQAAGVEAEPVGLDVVGVEARLVAALARVVDGELGHDLLEAAAVVRVPGRAVELGLGQPGVGQHVLVDDHRDRVPVLREAVLLAVGGLPQLGQPGQVLVHVDPARADGLDHLAHRELRVLAEVVGEDVGRRVGDEAARQAAPVVAPVLVLDLDLDVRVGLLEDVRALLVDGLLVGVPELVAQQLAAVGGGRGPVVAAAAGDDAQRAG